MRLRRWLLAHLTFTHSRHSYLSTACLHGQHGYCIAPTITRDGEWQTLGPSYSASRDEPKKPAECKFCTARCLCVCHDNREKT